MSELLASHFNANSDEFKPLETNQIPVTKPRGLPFLDPFQEAGRIRAFKKPKSMVKGDLVPALFTRFGDLLAIPLCSIYNEISRTRVWPLIWKEEFVTTIPKRTLPASINDLRNISCTMLASKIYESYVLNWVQEEVKVKKNQFGGSQGLCWSIFIL